MFLSRMCLKLGRCPGNPGGQYPWGGVSCGERVVCVCDTVAVRTVGGAGGGVGEAAGACRVVAGGVECTALVVVASGECGWDGVGEVCRRARAMMENLVLAHFKPVRYVGW